jgi:hypothetical protein
LQEDQNGIRRRRGGDGGTINKDKEKPMQSKTDKQKTRKKRMRTLR